MFGPERLRASGAAGVAGETDAELPGFGPFGTTGIHAFDPTHPVYRRIAAMARVRRDFPALRHGRQFLRPSRDPEPSGGGAGAAFGHPAAGAVFGWPRLLDDEELLCVANPDPAGPRGADILVEPGLNGDGMEFAIVLNSAETAGAPTPDHLRAGARLPVWTAADGTRYVAVDGLPPAEVLLLTNRP